MLGFKASLLKATEAAVASLLEIDGVIMENFCSATDDIHKAALFVSIFIDFTSNIINNFIHTRNI